MKRRCDHLRTAPRWGGPGLGRHQRHCHDHAPHPGSEKMQESSAARSASSLETALALALEKLVYPGKITLNRMVELFTTGPTPYCGWAGARWPRRSRDVTVFSTDLSWTYDVNQSFSRSRNSRSTGAPSAEARWPPW